MNCKNMTINLLMVLFSLSIIAQENYKVMFYNLLEFPDAPPQQRENILKTITDEIAPDLLMVCELTSANGANVILETSLATTDNRYKMATYIPNQSSGANLQQLVYYNSQKLTLEEESVIKTSVRDINHYLFKVLDSNDFLDVFVAHLKASQGFDNEQTRLDMVREFTLELARVPNDHYVLFTGDLNFYTSNEDGYQELLDPTNAIILKDPLNREGNWHTNASYADVHTQSTRTNSAPFDGYGAGGGLDDRFDFILVSENLINSSSLNYVTDSYKTIGNNGNCYNKNINDAQCAGTYSQNLRNALYLMSDHLPVLLEIESQAVLDINQISDERELLSFINGNVVTNMLQLKIDESLLNNTLIIYNNLGQEIKNVHIVPALIQQKTTLDISFLNQGVYYIDVKGLAVSNPIKFIKIN